MSSTEVYQLLGMKEREVETDEVIDSELQKTAEEEGKQLEIDLPEEDDDDNNKPDDNKE